MYGVGWANKPKFVIGTALEANLSHTYGFLENFLAEILSLYTNSEVDCPHDV